VAFTDAWRVENNGFSLTAVTRHGGAGASENGDPHIFHPFTADRLGPLVTVETPTGAFSYDGRCYVFACIGGFPSISYLTSSHRPDAPVGFRMHGEFSCMHDEITSTKFMQVAPCVVNNAEHAGLPTSAGEGVVLLGHGSHAGPDNVHLAWMPLRRGLGPDLDKRLYYAGGVPSRGVDWSPNEVDAMPLLDPPPLNGYTAVSAAWLSGPKRWILLYSLSREITNPLGGIVARVASDLFQWSDEIALVAPMHDHTLREKLEWQEKSGAYGAFLLNRFNVWCPTRGTMTLTYLMSTFRPYQVHVMQSQITLSGVPRLSGAWGAVRQRMRMVRWRPGG